MWGCYLHSFMCNPTDEMKIALTIISLINSIENIINRNDCEDFDAITAQRHSLVLTACSSAHNLCFSLSETFSKSKLVGEIRKWIMHNLPSSN